ncbi:MAG: 1,4-alpha-glucan branching protein GlgB [Deltaproteobacteria bacterium]|nr:1,4-alpha-glucan branching protein GlgB [Deltaproteobacteria bacterium]
MRPPRLPSQSRTAGDGTPPIGEVDLHLFNEGTHGRLDEVLGARLGTFRGARGAWFGVWAPNAHSVSVIGDFNDWKPEPLRRRGSSGIWEGFVPGVVRGQAYKYRLERDGRAWDKADPMALRYEPPPRTASVVWELMYDWRDAYWMARHDLASALDAPVSIYEVHLASWRRVPEEDDRPLTYRELAPLLADHVEKLGFTHVELLPVMEHPFGGSWGYQVTGYFAPTARLGAPEDFAFLVDTLHRRGIGVILDWVPAHFPKDPHALAHFDGTALYEHADPRQGFHPHWTSAIFNYGRNEVRSFLSSSALSWLRRYHADGLRVDGVASMLYLDYGREHGQWVPNRFGGRENLEAITLLRQVNEQVHAEHPGMQTFAEESTAWPMVSRPTYLGGLGFGYKWDLGWMHDTLAYFREDPIHRKYHHGKLTFRRMYAYAESFVLPLSHDEVVHGKGSLLEKMPGDDWRKFANLRLLYAYQWVTPGKKLLFMGGELAQRREWNHDGSLDWHLEGDPRHAGVMHLVGTLNHLYKTIPALHELDHDPAGFEWIDESDAEQSVLSFERRDRQGRRVIVVMNATPVVRHNYRVGVDQPGAYREILNTDAPVFGGGGQGNLGGVEASPIPAHGRPLSVVLTVPPLAVVLLLPILPGAAGPAAVTTETTGSPAA